MGLLKQYSIWLILLFCLFAGCAKSVEERNWVTMGTLAAVKLRGDTNIKGQIDEYAAAIKRTFAAVERDLSRFDDNSELNRLAQRSDDEVLASCDSVNRQCYAAAFQLRQESSGAFNPRWRGPHTLDLGAIAKGFAIDVAAESIQAKTGALLIDLGGNLKSVRGEWLVGIAGSDQTLMLKDGEACATSAEYFRGKHIYDARTGNAVTNELLSVTIVHPSSAMLADGLSTICFILGEAEGTDFLRRYYPEARAIWVRK